MRKVSTTILLIATCFWFSSCERVPGCTDINALNQDPNATRNDGTCQYEASVAFWYDQNTSNQLISAGYGVLDYYIAGELVGSMPVIEFGTFSSDCGDVGTVSHTRFITGASQQPFYYEVVDQGNNIVWSGEVTLIGGFCSPFQLFL